MWFPAFSWRRGLFSHQRKLKMFTFELKVNKYRPQTLFVWPHRLIRLAHPTAGVSPTVPDRAVSRVHNSRAADHAPSITLRERLFARLLSDDAVGRVPRRRVTRRSCLPRWQTKRRGEVAYFPANLNRRRRNCRGAGSTGSYRSSATGRGTGRVLFPWGYGGGRARHGDTARSSSVCSEGRCARLEPAGRTCAAGKRCPAPRGKGGRRRGGGGHRSVLGQTDGAEPAGGVGAGCRWGRSRCPTARDIGLGPGRRPGRSR